MPVGPLVRRDLQQLAARGRTYLGRLGLAGLMAAIVVLAAGEGLWTGAPQPGGAGAGLFLTIFWLLSAAIYLLLPMQLAPVIALERQRGTWELLLLTGLGPWRLLRQYCGIAIARVLIWVLLALPLFGLAYSLGGVDRGWLTAAACCLLASTVSVAAITLRVGAEVGDPQRAIWMSYLRLILWLLTAIVPLTLLYIPILMVVGSRLWLGMFGLWPPVVFQAGSNAGSSWWHMALACLPALALAGLALRRSARALQRRRPRREADAGKRADQGLARSWRQQGRHGILRLQQPIAWRERGRLLESLGSLPIAFGLMIIAALLVFSLKGSLDRGEVFLASAGQWLLPLLGGFGLLITVVSAFADERQQQTWDLLLVLPMAGSELLRQKVAVVLPLAKWLGSATVACWLLQALYEPAHYDKFLYLFFSLSHLLIHGALLLWLAIVCGLRCRQRLRGIVLALVIAAGWTWLPPLIAEPVAELLDWPALGLALGLVGPWAGLWQTAYLGGGLEIFSGWPAHLLALMLHLLLALALLANLLWRSDRYLQRCAPSARRGDDACG